ncbi:MAG TPA: Chromate resistance protein ChrB [Acidimicrobiales bacterium]|nr:Chromate resistance protein ChrB [Acidimicrobiales bacterium]
MAEPAETAPRVDGSAAWLVLVYRVPSEPTRLRATVWRRLKGLGAVYLQNSVAALPAGPTNERALRRLRQEITEMAGTAVLLAADAMVGDADIRESFRAARDDEYEEIVDRCEDFLGQVAKEHVAEHFTFAELEENEVDLAKLQSWFAKVTGRDPFGAPGRAVAEAALDRCRDALEGYAAMVYARAEEAH